MDYYNLSVFEFVTDQLGSQGTVCAGGRYDGLIGQIGGKPAPAVGWALGMERILELLKTAQLIPAQPVPDVFAVVPDAAAWPQVSQVLRVLRQHGLKVQMHACGPDGMGSMKSQFKKADGSGPSYAMVFGQDEMAQGMVSIKPLRAGEGSLQSRGQRLASLSDCAQWAGTLRA